MRTPKEELLAELDASFGELVAALPAIDGLASSPDSWGPFEVLSHIAGWHLSAAARLRQMARGEEVTPPGPSDEVNSRFVAERASLSGRELVAALQESFRELKDAARAVPESQFWRGQAGEEDSLAYFIVDANGPEHYREHLPELTRHG
jgi:hypothetical protein